MKLWLLYPRDDLPSGYNCKYNKALNPWSDTYDCAYGFVIRAETEAEARQIAAEGGGRETPNPDNDTHEPPWLTDRYSVCEELTADGDAGLIIQDFRAG